TGRDTIWPHDPRSGWSFCVMIPSWLVIPEARTVDGTDINPTVFYKVQIGIQSPNGITAARGILRRFSDFLKLYSTIRRTFPKKRVPPVPPKHSFLRNNSRPFLQERRRALEEWMEQLLSDIDISRSVAVASFIELEAAARSAITEINESQESSSTSFTISGFNSSMDLNIGSSVSSVAGHALVSSGVSPSTVDDGSDTVYEASDIGTPRQARDHESEIDIEDTATEKDLIINGEMKNGLFEDEQGPSHIRGRKSLFNSKEMAYVDGGTEFQSWHERKFSLDSNGSEASSIRGSEISNVGTFTSVTDGLVSFHGGVEHGTDDLSSIDLNFPNDVQAVLPLHERGKMKRVLNILQRQLVTAKTDMEDLIARLNQEVAAKEFLAAKVKDLDGELENYRHKSRETLNQAVLLERERVTQLQWDLEELRRKVFETEENYKLEQAARVHAEARMQEAELDSERVQHELDEMSEKLQSFQKDRDNAEAKTKAEMKFLAKELKLLRKSQPELKRELQHATNAKSELEAILQKERQKQEQATAARAKLLHEAAILRQRLQECSVDILSKGGDKYTVNASSIAEALDLLRTSDNRIGLLLAEAQLLAQQAEDDSCIAEQEVANQTNIGLHGNGNKLRLERKYGAVGTEAVASEAMVCKMLTDIFIDNAQLRKVVNSVT
ncbi:hypothetical protein KI387_025806, partial [Taxus chinensis]